MENSFDKNIVHLTLSECINVVYLKMKWVWYIVKEIGFFIKNYVLNSIYYVVYTLPFSVLNEKIIILQKEVEW